MPKSEPAAPAGDLLNREVLEELFDIMEGEATRLLQEYLDSAPNLLREVDKAVREGNAAALVLPAHSLKSSSANVGALQVSGFAKRLEFMGRENSMGEAAECWRGMQAAYASAEQALKAVIQRGSL